MEFKKTRANKKQQKLLVERLYSNIEMARGNREDPAVIRFWNRLASELNKLGCMRPVEKWQHIWSVWVGKVKTKERKIRMCITKFGKVPAGINLLDVERKILHIIGVSAIHEPARLKMEAPNSPESPPSPEMLQSEQSSPDPLEAQEPPQEPQPGPSRRRPGFRHRMPIPLRPSRPLRSLGYNDIVHTIHTLNESTNRLHEVIRESADVIAAAMRDSSATTLRAAEILAAAITSGQQP